MPSSPASFNWVAGSVWTGKQAIAWNNSDSASLDARQGTWRTIRPAPEIGRHMGFASFWTGQEALFWDDGGLDQGGDPLGELGVAYDPAEDRWRRIAPSPLPAGGGHVGAWDGHELLVWGPGAQGKAEAAAYDPGADRWRALPPGPLSARSGADAVWTGTEFLLWGGSRGGGKVVDGEFVPPTFLVDGAAYTPATNTWRRIPPAPLRPRDWNTALWTGKEMIIWGGTADFAFLGDGAAYDPALDHWRLLKEAPVARRSSGVAWDGREMLVWGGVGRTDDKLGEGASNDGFAYDPSEDSWRALPQGPLAPRIGTLTAWTGAGLLIFGGCCNESDLDYQDGAILKVAPSCRAPGSRAK